MTKDQQTAIEQAWLKRAKEMDYKPRTMKYLKAEVEFFAGAMNVLQVFFPHPDLEKLSEEVPRYWVIAPTVGRAIVELDKFIKTKTAQAVEDERYNLS